MFTCSYNRSAHIGMPGVTGYLAVYWRPFLFEVLDRVCCNVREQIDVRLEVCPFAAGTAVGG